MKSRALTKIRLQTFVIAMRKRGLSTGGWDVEAGCPKCEGLLLPNAIVEQRIFGSTGDAATTNQRFQRDVLLVN